MCEPALFIHFHSRLIFLFTYSDAIRSVRYLGSVRRPPRIAATHPSSGIVDSLLPPRGFPSPPVPHRRLLRPDPSLLLLRRSTLLWRPGTGAPSQQPWRPPSPAARRQPVPSGARPCSPVLGAPCRPPARVTAISNDFASANCSGGAAAPPSPTRKRGHGGTIPQPAPHGRTTRKGNAKHDSAYQADTPLLIYSQYFGLRLRQRVAGTVPNLTLAAAQPPPPSYLAAGFKDSG